MDKILLFYPNIPQNVSSELSKTLKTRWIGQGPKVDLFEQKFSNTIVDNRACIATGAGTDALHLSYLLSGIKKGDEVIAPVFTCTATNIPLLYIGAKIKFADIDPNTMNINVEHVKELVNEKTKAIICVHYGGLPCNMEELQKISKKWNDIPIIEDAAHALGAEYDGKKIGTISNFTIFSFQAIKHITTGDGGMLVLEDANLSEKAKRLRWFGIDREAKQKGMWKNDITEIGFKYQMTDIAATLGLSALTNFQSQLQHRQKLFSYYKKLLQNIPGLKFVGGECINKKHAAWLCTVLVKNRKGLQIKLEQNNIESGQVHYRNDKYSIFEDYLLGSNLYNMDNLEDNYLVLPLHSKISLEDIEKICHVIKSGW